MGGKEGFSELSQALMAKTLTKKELLKKVENDFGLIPLLIEGVGHPRAAVRYGCSKVLLDLSEEYPKQLYPNFDFFVDLLDSKYRILKWTALAIVANLTKVDGEKKFDAVFGKYYGCLDDEYMVTVANTVANSATIAKSKPYLVPKITDELLKVQNLSITPHLTEECKQVIAQQVVKTFDTFFDIVEQKQRVFSFIKAHKDSSRKALKAEAEKFLSKWG
jgi:hypothetical protein